MAGQHRFAAFISYSSADGAFAKRLHRALESYRVPAGAGAFNLAGKANRVAPIFLDRAELSSGELGGAIKSAIETSSALIVVCSPHAVQSQWVDQEIRHFIQTGRVRRVFAIIASGEPFASMRGAAQSECFPAALRELAHGKFGDAYEVVAGDARPGKDGFRNAWLKVAAGILDVGFGKLLDRDAAARRGRTMLMAGATAVIAAVVGTLTTFWFLESQRYQSEARSSLLREARSSFELDDNPRAMTALAHLFPAMSAEDRAAYEPILNAWSARFPHFAASLANTPAAFAYDDRVFLRTPQGILAVPLPADTVIASSPAEPTVLGIDFSGRVWRWRPGEAAAEALKLPADVLGHYDWESAAKLRAGGAAFGGAVQATYAGGADPVLLLVNDTAGSYALAPLQGAALEDFRLATDCSAFAFPANAVDLAYDELSETDEDYSAIDVEDQFYRFDLQGASAKREAISEDVFESIPPLKIDPDGDHFKRADLVVAAVAAACGDGGVAQGPPAKLNTGRSQTVQDGSLPPDDPAQVAAGKWDWISHDIWGDGSDTESGINAPEVARLVELTDAIQRAKIEMGDITRIRDGVVDTIIPENEIEFETEEAEDQADATLVSYEYGARLGLYLSLDDAGSPTLSFSAAEGKYTGSDVCGFAGGKVRCINMTQTGWGVAFASFPDFVYAGGTTYMDYPAFTLIDRKTLNAVEFRSDEIKISQPAHAGSVALSPSGKQLAIAFSRTVLLFELDDKLTPKLSRKLSVPGLAAETGDGLMPVCAALTYLDEGTLVASRGDGLSLKLDINSGDELWRFRLPASGSCDNGYVPVQTAPLKDGSAIAVRGSSFVAVLDTRTGLPLLPAATFYPLMRWEDDGYSEETVAQMAGDYDAAPAPDSGERTLYQSGQDCIENGVNCRSPAELLRLARNLVKISEPLLSVLPSGELFARTQSSLISLPPIPTERPAVSIAASPQCFTGWQVAGSRIEPFNLMRGVEVGGPPVAEADILARCK